MDRVELNNALFFGSLNVRRFIPKLRRQRQKIVNNRVHLFDQKQSKIFSKMRTFIIAGHVDAGKSTICGQILYQTGYYTSHDLEAVRKEAVPGREWALLSGTEDPTGKTMDCATFDLPELRMIDTPGHTVLITRLIDAAQTADLVVYVMSVADNEFDKGVVAAREHFALFRSVGLTNLIVILNKIDCTQDVDSREQQIRKMTGSAFEVSFFRMTANQNPPIHQLLQTIRDLPLKETTFGPMTTELTLTGESNTLLVLGKSLIFYTGKSQSLGELVDIKGSSFARPRTTFTSTWKLSEPIAVAKFVVGRDPSTGKSVLIGKT